MAGCVVGREGGSASETRWATQGGGYGRMVVDTGWPGRLVRGCRSGGIVPRPCSQELFTEAGGAEQEMAGPARLQEPLPYRQQVSSSHLSTGTVRDTTQ